MSLSPLARTAAFYFLCCPLFATALCDEPQAMLGLQTWSSWDRSKKDWSDLIVARGLPRTGGSGVLVHGLAIDHVNELVVNDIIVRIDDTPIQDLQSWNEALQNLRIGVETKVVIKRVNKETNKWSLETVVVKPLDRATITARNEDAFRKKVFKLRVAGTVTGDDIERSNEQTTQRYLRYIVSLSFDDKFTAKTAATNFRIVATELCSSRLDNVGPIMDSIAKKELARDIESLLKTPFGDTINTTEDGRALSNREIWTEAMALYLEYLKK